MIIQTEYCRVLSSIPGDLKYKGAAAMLVVHVQTREAIEEYIVIRRQHGYDDVTCNPANVHPYTSIQTSGTHAILHCEIITKEK